MLRETEVSPAPKQIDRCLLSLYSPFTSLDFRFTLPLLTFDRQFTSRLRNIWHFAHTFHTFAQPMAKQTCKTMVMAMFKKRKNQPKVEPKTNPPPSPPNNLPALPNTSPNGLHALPNAPRPQDSTPSGIQNTANSNENDDEIAKFAKQSGIPESIVRIEFKIIQSLYNASHRDIINRYQSLPVPALLPILKLRYIRNFWKQLNQNKT
jgi:hypothetical protein